jgi:hypothetical protein
MEALFILLADLIILPLTLVATVLASGIAAFTSALASMLESVFGIVYCSGSKTSKPALSPEALEAIKLKAQRRRNFLKRLSWTLAGIVVLMVAVVCLLNFVLFESTVRWGLARIGKRSGVEISFASASGSFFSGEMALKKVAAQRQGSGVSNFDLRADEFSVNLSMTQLLKRSSRIEKIFISGLNGEFHRVTAPDRMKIRKNYEVDHLRLERADIDIRDTSRPEEAQFTLKISELDSQPLRSRFAVFDILFRSNASGEIAGQPFLIQMKKTESGRETVWQVDQLLVLFAARYIGGPIKYLTGGTIDVRVEDKWKIGKNTEIEMHWSFLLKDLVVVPPEGASLKNHLVASAIAEYLRRNAEKLDVSFNLIVNENQFEGTASAGAAGLWDTTRESLVRELSRLSGADTNRLNQRIKTGVDWMKLHLENSRKKSP